MYSEWARRRRFTYISAISGVLLLIVGSLLYAATYEPPGPQCCQLARRG